MGLGGEARIRAGNDRSQKVRYCACARSTCRNHTELDPYFNLDPDSGQTTVRSLPPNVAPTLRVPWGKDVGPDHRPEDLFPRVTTSFPVRTLSLSGPSRTTVPRPPKRVETPRCTGDPGGPTRPSVTPFSVPSVLVLLGQWTSTGPRRKSLPGSEGTDDTSSVRDAERRRGPRGHFQTFSPGNRRLDPGRTFDNSGGIIGVLYSRSPVTKDIVGVRVCVYPRLRSGSRRGPLVSDTQDGVPCGPLTRPWSLRRTEDGPGSLTPGVTVPLGGSLRGDVGVRRRRVPLLPPKH